MGTCHKDTRASQKGPILGSFKIKINYDTKYNLLIKTRIHKSTLISVMSDSLQPHGLQHTRLPCPSPTPGACSNSCPSTQWYHPAISSSVIPVSSCLQSFPASGSFQMSQLIASGGQSIGVSASGLISFRMDWLHLLEVQGILTSLIQHHSLKASTLWRSAFFTEVVIKNNSPNRTL